MDTLFGLVLKFWIWGVQLLVIWLVVALFLPNINWYEHVEWLALVLIVDPALSIFAFFGEYVQSVRHSDWASNNPIQDGVSIMLILGSIVCALALPLLFWFGWFIISLVAIGEFIPKSVKNGLELGPEGENMWHLVNGRTTIQKTFDAEVQANAIASALNKHR